MTLGELNCVLIWLYLSVAVVKIATNANCSLAERERFDVCLQQLIKSCDYSLKGSSVSEDVDSALQPTEDTETTQPLIIK